MSTVICESCGLANNAEAVFCTECGATLEIATHQPPMNKSDPFQALPGPRSFMRWGIYIGLTLVISSLVNLFPMFSFAFSTIFVLIFNMILRIPYSIYINQNFKDHRKLMNATHGYHLQPPDPSLMAVLYVLLPIIPMFIKYREFRDHLLKDHQNEDIVPFSPYAVTGIVFVLPFLFSYLLAGLFSFFIYSNFEFTFYLIIVFAFPIIALIYRLFAEYKWQKSMNTHIHNHIGFLSK